MAKCQSWARTPSILAPVSVPVTTSEQIQTNHPLTPHSTEDNRSRENHIAYCLQKRRSF